MAYDEITALLGGWEGFELIGVDRQPGPQVVLRLRPLPTHAKRCSGCGAVVAEVHETTERRVRDLPILDAETWLLVPRARLACPRCGPTVETVPWLDRYARMTTRFADAIARLAQVLPIKHVAQWYGVDWDTVKHIDQRALAARLGPVDLSAVRVLAIDEFAIHRGHRYATVVIDPTTKRVLWIGRGRGREDLGAFFTWLGPVGCARIVAIAVDMSPAYTEEIRHHCPQAAIVYDLFHVVAKYGREVIDRVRVDETNRLAGRAAASPERVIRARRRLIKGARWLLLRNRQHVTRPHDRVRLRELLQANRALFIVYVLKDDLKQLWRFRYPGAARRFWAQWYERAIASRLAPLIVFANQLALRLEGVISHCRYPLHTGILEGINNKIKVIKRMAYGFRDDDYFFLKIRAAFPGIP